MRPFVGGHREDAVGLHRHPGEPLAHHGHLSDGRRTFDRVGVVALGELGAEADVRAVLREQEGSVGRERLGGGHHRRQRVVVDDDGLGGVDRLCPRLGHDRGDDVADEAHLVGREDGAVQGVGHHREALQAREAEVVATSVVHGEHAGHRCRRAHVDRCHLGVGDRRPHERDVGHVRLDQVVDVLSAAGQQRRILEPLDRVAEDRTRCGHVTNPR